MVSKRSSKDHDSQQSEKLTKSRPALARLAKDDITAILYVKELKGESKKVSEWYKIGTPKYNKIWKSENSYSYANSIEDANLPNWYPNNTKIEKAEILPEPMPQEIITPEKPVIIKSDPIEVKRKRETTEIKNIAR
ncbi:7875_t:CDS:1 [Diversispora eburnea]|uniref:7875_t:CDS:1 n=1 Tax=Diversispora eburnea TaxID=1213867 RepID=A0A9N9GLR3_9GLOM|nr:7875_t:CDS:1 [Diversispora eburnea]